MQVKFLLNWYEKILVWSQHPKAVRYLGFVSFVDASLFPVSPLFMILPMSFSKPHRSFYYALVAIVGSFFGGIIGYYLGAFAAESVINPFIQFMGYTHYYDLSKEWFQNWGFWAVLFGCFSPFIPYKIFTIGSGLMKLDFVSFLLASLFGRALRFLVIATVVYWGGPKMEPFLRRLLLKMSERPTSQ